ncbi:MAG: hypothetical protein WC609_03910 [Candidatus Paceibacterota bacterium]
MNWRNERSLYKRTCDLCQKNIITIYSEDKPYKVYCNECFHGDGWNATDYGLDLDFSKPFLQQFRELQLKVPRLYAFVFQNHNSDYVNGAAYNKNCYLIFVSDHNEDSLYSHNIFNCKNTMDSLNSTECEFLYDSITCKKSYRVLFSEDCSNSQDLYFCKNCSNCHDCIASVNLRNQQYCIFNKQYSKEEYLKEKEKIGFSLYKNMMETREKAKKFWLNFPVKYVHGLQNIDISGDYIFGSKNSHNIFNSDLLENCNYVNYGNKAKDCMDGYVVVDNCELSHEIVSAISLNNAHSCYCAWHCFDTFYCDTCENVDNLFGCVGLKKKKYCILNKQYTKEKYEELIPKIKQHMKDMPYKDKNGKSFVYGDFFPSEFSPFCYNETAVQENFPLTHDEALKNGYPWKEKETRNYKIDIKAEDLSDNVSEEILEKVIGCAHHDKNNHEEANCEAVCTEAFKITPDELQFYKRMDLPLPRLCPNCRHYNRLKQKNPLTLWRRSCMCELKNHTHGDKKCKNEFETSYSPDRAEIVYCESCYQQEVY